MPQGDKSSYTSKQKRQAEHIADGYAKRGTSKKTAKKRAWATVNAMTGGGKKSGAGRGKKVNKAPAKKGGRLGGAATKKKAAAKRKSPAKKRSVATRKSPAKKKTAQRAAKKSAARKRAS